MDWRNCVKQSKLLRDEMRNSFALVNQKLDIVIDLSTRIFATVTDLRQDIQIANEGIFELKAGLVTLGDRLRNDLKLFAQITSETKIALCLDYKRVFDFEMEPIVYTECLTKFYRGATYDSRSELYLAKEQLNEDKFRDVLDRPLSELVPYVAKFAKATLKNEDISELAISFAANVSVWSAATEAYLRLVADSASARQTHTRIV